MFAPQLTISEQKKAISGKKKKKQALKNVLNIPNNLKVESYFLEISKSEELKTILERLLPTARLSVRENTQISKNGGTKLNVEAKRKRDQLILGVNALTRSIKKNSVAAVLLASDIQPKFLIHHLSLLCNYNKVPLLHINGLRQITKDCLGFVCIALGFKKDFGDFNEALNVIKALAETKNKDLDEDREAVVDISDSSDEEEIEDLAKNEESVTYLYRTSTNERIFIPEKSLNNEIKEKPEDFIKLKNYETEIQLKNKLAKFGVSNKFKNQNQKRRLKNIDESESSDTDDEDLKIPKKKSKRYWVINKASTKPNIKYCSANLMKVFSNLNRNQSKK